MHGFELTEHLEVFPTHDSLLHFIISSLITYVIVVPVSAVRQRKSVAKLAKFAMRTPTSPCTDRDLNLAQGKSREQLMAPFELDFY